MKKPDLLIESNIVLNMDDFPHKFHKIVFGVIKNLHQQGLKVISPIDIEIFLGKYPEQYKIFSNNENKGLDYLEYCIEFNNLDMFNYYLNRIKKFTILRKLEENGFNIKEIYDEKDEKTLKKFDEMELEDLLNYYNKKLLEIENSISLNNKGIHASEKLLDYVNEYKRSPEMGLDSGINALNYIAYGLRKKYYLFSAPSSGGKSRFMIYFAIQTAIKQKEPTLFISTEMEYDEVQLAILAGVSGINERKILLGKLINEEYEKIKKSIEIIKNSKIYIVYMPNYDIEQLENTIKRYVLTNGVSYVMFDYIKESLSMLNNFNNKITKRMEKGLRTDQMLYLVSERLKTLSGILKIGIISGTQVSSNFFNAEKTKTKGNQSMIAGSKAIIYSADFSAIIRYPYKDELESFDLQFYNPNNEQILMLEVIKNRRGEKDVVIGLLVNLGTLQIKDFITIKNNEIIEIPQVKFNTEEMVI